jgi:hypothetical protein
MAKGKMPPQLLEYLKKKEAKKEDGSEMNDKEKRKAALDKARKYKKTKNKKQKSELVFSNSAFPCAFLSSFSL